MKLAVITPWPQQSSGISDSAYAIASGLSRYCPCEVTVYTTNPLPKALEGVKIRSHASIESDCLNDRYDLVLMHMGNNNLHIGYLDILKRVRCVVHLHDMVLHHLIAGMTSAQNDIEGYLKLFEKWYGNELKEINQALLMKGYGVWDTAAVTNCPFFEPVIEHAQACIVTSNYIQRRLHNRFPKKPIHLVNLINKTEDHLMPYIQKKKPLSRHDGLLHIGVFGFVSENKQHATFLDVIQREKGIAEKIRVHIVGEITEACSHLEPWSKECGLEACVSFYGHVSGKRWLELMSSMDLVAALRHPTMGETSGVVVDALSLGIPVIVNKTGSYKELPRFVKKLDIDHIREDLSAYLLKLIEDPAYLAHLKKRAYEYTSAHDFCSLSKRYYQALLHEID